MGVFSGFLNIFRILGDISHISSVVILIWAIHANKSAEGVSLLTQALYALVFLARYTDIFWTPVFVGRHSPWATSRFLLVYNFFGKLFFISTSLYVVWLMAGVYARTREREKAWKLGLWCLAAAALLAAPTAWLFQNYPIGNPYGFSVSQVVWAFSIVLESVCVMPQLLLLRQTAVPTVIDSCYLLALGSYRAFYILNWVVRAADDRHFDPVSVVFGIVQTALYVDFAYVYYTRQRVKLRNGGVVDSDDFRQGLLVRRFLGRKGRGRGSDEEDGLAPARAADGRAAGGGTRWGARGISVSADDGVRGDDGKPGGEQRALTDPGAFEDEDEEEGDDDPDLGPERGSKGNGHVSGIGNGRGWRDEERR